MKIAIVLRALVNKRRLPIPDWLRDPKAAFPHPDRWRSGGGWRLRRADCGKARRPRTYAERAHRVLVAASWSRPNASGNGRCTSATMTRSRRSSASFTTRFEDIAAQFPVPPFAGRDLQQHATRPDPQRPPHGWPIAYGRLGSVASCAAEMDQSRPWKLMPPSEASSPTHRLPSRSRYSRLEWPPTNA